LRAVDPDHETQTRITAVAQPRGGAAGHGSLVVIHSPAQSELGKRYVLDKDVTTIGRGRDNDIVLPSDCVSRRHLRLEQRDGAAYLIDLASTNGTYVNDQPKPVREQRLAASDQIRVGDTIFKYLVGSDVEVQYHEVVFRMAVTDGLTGLANRKHLDTLLVDEIARARRHARPLSVLMFDIDLFKRVNDTYGHLAGDSVLRGVAAILEKRLRPNDRLGRYGGEEFCAMLPETPAASAVRIAEELRALVEEHAFVSDDREVRVTISVGVAALGAGMQLHDLYRAADEMLYEAKRAGRNRVCI
jgi:diguanylate cyclase (GGDEF)-like protein